MVCFVRTIIEDNIEGAELGAETRQKLGIKLIADPHMPPPVGGVILMAVRIDIDSDNGAAFAEEFLPAFYVICPILVDNAISIKKYSRHHDTSIKKFRANPPLKSARLHFLALVPTSERL